MPITILNTSCVTVKCVKELTQITVPIAVTQAQNTIYYLDDKSTKYCK